MRRILGRRSDFMRRKFLGRVRPCQEGNVQPTLSDPAFSIARDSQLWLTLQTNMPLRQIIKAAFATVPYPGDHNITRCPYHCKPCQEIADYFKGKGWEGHSVDDLRDHHTALSLFTPEA